MIKNISEDNWLRYNALVSPDRKSNEPPLPANLPYQGRIEEPIDYDHLLRCLREWLTGRGEFSVFYFLTESMQGQDTDFQVSTSDLVQSELLRINNAMQSVVVGHDFDWAIFMDDEGTLHVAGPPELLLRLSQCKSPSDSSSGLTV